MIKHVWLTAIGCPIGDRFQETKLTRTLSYFTILGREREKKSKHLKNKQNIYFINYKVFTRHQTLDGGAINAHSSMAWNAKRWTTSEGGFFSKGDGKYRNHSSDRDEGDLSGWCLSTLFLFFQDWEFNVCLRNHWPPHSVSGGQRKSVGTRPPGAKARSEEMTSALLSFLRRRCSSEPRPVFSPVLSLGSSLCNNNQNKGVINTFNCDRIINNILVVLWCWKL